MIITLTLLTETCFKLGSSQLLSQSKDHFHKGFTLLPWEWR